MLPIFTGRAINPDASLNKNHPLVLTGMAACYRFLPPVSNSYILRNLTGDTALNAVLLSNARIYGPDGPVRGSSARQSTGQLPQIPAAIWSGRAITVALWAKFNTFPNLGTVYDTLNKDLSFHVGSGGATTNACQVYRANHGTGTITLSRTLQPATWYRLVVGIDSAGAVTVWVDGQSSGTGSVGTFALGDIDTLDMGNNTSGAANNMDGNFADIFIWRQKLTDAEALLDYQEAVYDYPKLFPKFGIWERAPRVGSDGAATVGTIGTITLTAPTVNAANVVDATATMSTTLTINLTVPTMVAGQDDTATIDTIGTITLTVPTLTATTPDATGTVGTIGTITMYAPTVAPIGSKPPNNYQQQFYWGRFSRGQHVNVVLDPLYLTDSVPVARFWLDGSTKVKQVNIPVSDPDQATFGMPILIDQDFADGHYIVAISFGVDNLPYTVIAYMEVVGGSPQAPVTSTLEIDRTNGRALVYGDESGYIRVGYSPSLSGELE